MAPKLRQTKTICFNHVFTRDNPGKVDDFYEMSKQNLGEGSYGQVCTGKHKNTGKTYAIKAIDTSKISDVSRFEAEVGIQKMLDHPNIVKLYEVFKDAKKVYLVMEICTGGELFDRIIEEAEKNAGEHAFGEADAATYMRQIMRALYYLHSHNFAHRDIKPENFLLQHKGRDAEIKVIDFGLAKKFKEGEMMRTKAGTPYYVAPQVLAGSYNEKCDIWSCGVIMYILLCGYPPFYGDTDQEILKAVKRGQFDFPPAEWESTSQKAKDLIKSMLTMDVSARPDATTVLSHPWFEIIATGGKSDILKADFGKKLRDFRGVAKLKKVALTMIATQMSDKEVSELKATFEAMDANNDGTLTIQEITEGMQKHKLEVPGDLIENIKRIDTDGSGSIDYTEFIAATMTTAQYYRQDVLWQAFRMFDHNGDGSISQGELAEVMKSQEAVDPHIAQKMIAEVDLDGDGKLSFAEFCTMMEGADSPTAATRRKAR